MVSLLYAACLLACLEAFGGSLSFWTVLALSIAGDTLAQLVPVPGGGTAVASVGLSAAMIAFGVPKEIAVASVLANQLVVAVPAGRPGVVRDRASRPADSDLVTGRFIRWILIVRHGQSTWNAEQRWQGQADPPLSALGERQAGPPPWPVASMVVRHRGQLRPRTGPAHRRAARSRAMPGDADRPGGNGTPAPGPASPGPRSRPRRPGDRPGRVAARLRGRRLGPRAGPARLEHWPPGSRRMAWVVIRCPPGRHPRRGDPHDRGASRGGGACGAEPRWTVARGPGVCGGGPPLNFPSHPLRPTPAPAPLGGLRLPLLKGGVPQTAGAHP